MDFIEACKKHSKYSLFDGACLLETQSSSGEPLMVRITFDEIRAYRKEKPNIIVTKEMENKIKMDTAPELEDYFSRTPVMYITRWDEDKFTVDFEAGFQRGRYTHQTEEDVCNRLTFDDDSITTKKPWFKWIGLDCKEDLVKGFVKGDLER